MPIILSYSNRVNVLAVPGASHVQASGAVAIGIVLTPACERVKIYATQGIWYSLTGAASAGDHYLGPQQTDDIAVPPGTTISIIREAVDGSVRISEMGL